MRKRNVLLCALCFTLSSVTLTGCNSKSMSNDKLVIGLECEYAPFNWTETKANDYTLPISNMSGYADGYDVQIAKYLAKEMNVEVEIQKIVWDSLIPSLQSNTINCIIAGMSKTEERDQTIDFTENYYVSKMMVIVKKDSDIANITNIQQLSGKKVVSQRGTLTYDIIDQINGVTKVPAVDTFNIAALGVQSNTYDAMTAEEPVAKSIVKANSDLKYIEFSPENGFSGLNQNELGVAVGIKEGNTELQSKINAALSKLTEQERTNMMDGAVSRAPGNE